MSYRLPCLPALCLLALSWLALAMTAGWPARVLAQQDVAAPAQLDPAAEGERLIVAARDRLSTHASITARLRQQVNLFDQKLIGSGMYLQHSAGEAMVTRLELKVQVAGRVGSLLQVNDGRYIWTDQQMDSQRSTSRIDVRAVLAARDPRDPAAPDESLAVSGLTQLLASAEANFQFVLAGEQEFDSVPVYVLAGQWRQERLQRLLGIQSKPDDPQPEIGLDRLAEYVPHRMLVVLRRSDLFPCVIDYQRRSRAGEGEKSAAYESIVWMQFYDIDTDTPIDLHAFVYAPGDIEVSDDTSRFISRDRSRRKTLEKIQ